MASLHYQRGAGGKLLETISISMKISVITVVYNAVGTIADTLRSIAGQNYPDVEHIVVDGASTDGTWDVILENGARIDKCVSEPDHGMYDAMNKGLHLATGDVIGFLNSDDVYADDTVLAQIAETFRTQEIDSCYADLVYVNKTDLNKVTRYWKSRPYENGLFEKGWMPAHPTFYVRQWVYDNYGGYNLAYRRQSDFELAMRFLAVHHIRSAYIPRVLVRMRSGGASDGLMHIIKGNIEAYCACKKHGLSVSPIFMPRKVMSRIPQFFQRPSSAQKQ